MDAGEIFKMIFLLLLIIYMVCHFAIEFKNNKYQKIRLNEFWFNTMSTQICYREITYCYLIMKVQRL